MQTGGKWVVLGMLALAVAATLGAWVWNYRHSERALAFWGPKHALRVRTATEVELWTLTPAVDNLDASPPSSVLTAGGRSFRAVARQDLSRANGLIHARHALTDGASFAAFQGDGAPLPQAPNWTHAVRFSAENGVTSVLFDFPARRIFLVEEQRPAQVSVRLADGWRDFCQRQLPSEARVPAALPATSAPPAAGSVPAPP